MSYPYPQNNPYQQKSYGAPPAAYQPGGYRPQQSSSSSSYNNTYSSTNNNSRPRDVEMSSLVHSAAPVPYTSSLNRDPHAIINECRAITDEITSINSQLSTLQTAQMRSLNDPNNTHATADLEATNTRISSNYKALIERMKYIKSRPDSGAPMNQNQIGLADRQLRDAWARYRIIENNHSKKMREQIERQYRISRPDATDDEVRAAAEDPNAQIFAQAIMNSNRRGESRAVLGAVRERHEAIAKIERQMQELATLFQEMAETVAVQDPMVQNIEKSATETHENVEAGVNHLVPAVKSARAARKKKWICFWLTILIIIILIIILIIVLKVTGIIP